ncbi:conjugative transposon protein TraM [Pedobacter psychroterrae]|uniref:Conjugative transposon protein TraM n=2 Tax=Pedobacter psychroterrae TaxID=2530453 RepID=A0A4R0NVC4_9SPHI|nr:conjugative transposon protein TraM [Pedobacter psychroterrae]
MAFWALGGGSKPPVAEVQVSAGLNTVLPDAQLKGKNEQDKMSLYEQAQKLLKDSADAGATLLAADVGGNLPGAGGAPKPDATEAAINAKLAQIHAQVNAPTPLPMSSVKPARPVSGADPGLSSDVARLEKLMQTMKESGGGEDPEMQQLNLVMDKIMAIQNPDLGRPAVSAPSAPDSFFRAIPALVAGTVKAMQGSVIELRLLDSVTINGQFLRAGHSVFGVAEFSNQRIGLEIKNIRLGTSIIPVSLSTYDKRDGMRGINAPEALLSEAFGKGSVDAMSGIGLMGFDQNLGTQIAGAGLGAVKGLLSKKIKRVKQKLDAGYPVLLRDNTLKVKSN